MTQWQNLRCQVTVWYKHPKLLYFLLVAAVLRHHFQLFLSLYERPKLLTLKTEYTEYTLMLCQYYPLRLTTNLQFIQVIIYIFDLFLSTLTNLDLLLSKKKLVCMNIHPFSIPA